jgi:hypothetical protein
MSRRDATRVMGDLRVPDDLRKLANAIEDAEKAAVLQDLVLEIDWSIFQKVKIAPLDAARFLFSQKNFRRDFGKLLG